MDGTHRHYNIQFSIGFLFLLLLVLSACANGGDTTKSGTYSATTTTTQATAATSNGSLPPGVKAGVQPCLDAVKATSYWDGILKTSLGDRVESVSCANLIGKPSLQALVTVRSAGTAAMLSVYVYNNISDKTPTQLFKLEFLPEGEASISNHNTILTGQVDPNSSINKGQPNSRLKRDLFREFKWSDSKSTFVQTASPSSTPTS